MSMFFLKQECHRMMREMFRSNKRAYIWLYYNVGYEVHFSEIHDKTELKRIHALLKERYDRKITSKKTS